MIVDSCIAVPAASSMWTVQQRRIGRGSDGVGRVLTLWGLTHSLGPHGWHPHSWSRVPSPHSVAQTSMCAMCGVCQGWSVSWGNCAMIFLVQSTPAFSRLHIQTGTVPYWYAIHSLLTVSAMR